ERGGEDEHPRGVGPDRAVRDLGRDRVEGRHRLGEVHGVVEPEALVVVRLEPGEVGVHGPPALGARGVRDLRRKREPGTALGGYQGGRPPEASRVRVHRALLVTPLCAGPHRRRWHSGTAGSMAYATISPGQILGHAPKQAHGSFVVRPCRHRDLPDRVRELPPEGGSWKARGPACPCSPPPPAPGLVSCWPAARSSSPCSAPCSPARTWRTGSTMPSTPRSSLGSPAIPPWPCGSPSRARRSRPSR